MTSDDILECPACGITALPDRFADLDTRVGPISVCKACHPGVSPLDMQSMEVDHADG